SAAADRNPAFVHPHLARRRTMHRRRPPETIASEICESGPSSLRALEKANHQRTVRPASKKPHAQSNTVWEGAGQ
ncbi:MAG: hypothetical protein ABMA01_24820, partial [Chthoniobacteraceae bacterium]